MYYDRVSIEIIQKNIEKSLKMHRIKCKVNLEYNGRALSVTNNKEAWQDGHLYMWIRLLPTQNGTYYVDITNIVLPLDKRRSGVFQTLFDRLNKCKYVEKPRIISVCTAEMQRWCIKNNLTEFQTSCYY